MTARDEMTRANEQAVSIQHLARQLNVSTRTTRRLIVAGALRAHRVGRQWRVFESDLQQYLAGQANSQAA
jgi:excisionase family DNA binding protein